MGFKNILSGLFTPSKSVVPAPTPAPTPSTPIPTPSTPTPTPSTPTPSTPTPTPSTPTSTPSTPTPTSSTPAPGTPAPGTPAPGTPTPTPGTPTKLIKNTPATLVKPKGLVKNTAYEMFVNNLIASPSTHITNFMANMSALLTRPGETLTRAAITILADPAEKTYFSEVGASFTGLAVGMWQALRFGVSTTPAFLTPKANQVFENNLLKYNYPVQFSQNARIEANKRFITGQSLGLGDSKYSKSGFNISNVAALAADVTGMAQNMPGTTLNWADISFKVANTEVYLAEQAAHMVKIGTATSMPDARHKLLSTPELLKRVVEDAENRTYMGQPKLGVSQFITSKYADTCPGLRWVVPFRRAIANSLEYSFERSPFALAFPAFRERLFSSNLSTRYDAISKMIWGSTVLTSLGVVLSDNLTGQLPKEKLSRDLYESSGFKEYTITIGDSSISLDRLGPIGNIFKVVALYNQWATNLDVDSIMQDITTEGKNSQEFLETFAGFVQPVALVAFDQFWLNQVAEFTTVFEKAIDEGNIGPLQLYAEKIAARTAPTGNRLIDYLVTKNIDNYKHKYRDFGDYLKSTIPILSSKVPYAYTLFGQPMLYQKYNGPGARDLAKDPFNSDHPVVQDLINYDVQIKEPRGSIQLKIGDQNKHFYMFDPEWKAFNEFRATGIPQINLPPMLDYLEVMRPHINKLPTVRFKKEMYNRAINNYMNIVRNYMKNSPDFTFKQRIETAVGFKKEELEQAMKQNLTFSD